MVTEEFLLLVPGTIGEVSYQKRVFQKVPDKVREDFVDKFVGAKMKALLVNSTFAPGLDPVAEYAKAREMAREELESRVGIKQDKITIQVDNKESFDLIKKIESEQGFMQWDFPAFVQMFKESYLSNLSK
jgi:hypothetical protein